MNQQLLNALQNQEDYVKVHYSTNTIEGMRAYIRDELGDYPYADNLINAITALHNNALISVTDNNEECMSAIISNLNRQYKKLIKTINRADTSDDAYYDLYSGGKLQRAIAKYLAILTMLPDDKYNDLRNVYLPIIIVEKVDNRTSGDKYVMEVKSNADKWMSTYTSSNTIHRMINRKMERNEDVYISSYIFKMFIDDRYYKYNKYRYCKLENMLGSKLDLLFCDIQYTINNSRDDRISIFAPRDTLDKSMMKIYKFIEKEIHGFFPDYKYLMPHEFKPLSSNSNIMKLVPMELTDQGV